MQITFKLYASLTDYLPPEARRDNRITLDVAPDATIAQIIEPLGMPPKLVSDDGRHTVIRPLAHVAERDLATWADHRQFPIIPCTLCGSQDNLQRVQVKKMIHEWERQYPGRIDNMATAMGNITLSHMMDRQLFPFTSIRPTGRPDAQGDKAFDADDNACATPAPAMPQPIVWQRTD